MPVARFEMPDGRIARFEVPEGTTPEQAQAMIQQSLKDDKPLAQRLLGNAAAGMVRGAGSIGATLLTPYDMLMGNTKSIGNPERRKAMDDALATIGYDTSSLAFSGGKLGGEIAGTMGVGGALAGALAKAAPSLASAAPGALDAIRSAGVSAAGATGAKGMMTRMLGGGITGGVAAAAIDPEAAGMGATLGAALPPALAAAGKAGGAVGSALRPKVADPVLAEKAINQYGIPLGVSDIARSPMVKGARSALDDAAFIGKIGQNRRDAVQGGFNRAIGQTFGENSTKLTPQVMDDAKKRLGSEFDRIWGGNTLKIDGGLVADLQRIESEALSKLNPEQAASVSRQIQNLLQKAQGTDIDGAFANNWQSELRMVTEGEKGLHKKLMGDLRGAVLKAFGRSIPASDSAALTLAKEQYKAFKTVEPIVLKAEAGVAGREVGDVAPGLLPSAVVKSYGGNISASPFADLTQIGSQYVANRVPQTGGSARAAVQNTLTGAGLGLGFMGNPLLPVAALGGATGLEALLSSPGVAKKMVSPQVQGLLQQLELERLLSLSAPAIAADQ